MVSDILGNEESLGEAREAGNPDSGTDSQQLVVGDDPTGEQAQKDSSDSFFSGNPMELPDDVRPFYTSMQGQFTRSMQGLRSQERELASRLADADTQLRELGLLKARHEAQLHEAPAEAPAVAAPVGPTDEELAQRVSELARDGKPFEALSQLADAMSERKVSALRSEYDTTLSEMRTRLDALQGAVKPAQEQSEIRAAWSRVQQERPEFQDSRVQEEIVKLVTTPPPRIARLMEKGLHEEALELAGLQAVRAVETNKALSTARQRTNAGLPPGGNTSSNGNGAGTSGVDWNASVREIMDSVIANDSTLKGTFSR